MRWLLVLGALGGCHAGIGPVLASGDRGGRVGLELSAGAGPLGLAAGGTHSWSDGPSRGYMLFEPGFPVGGSGEGRNTFLITMGGTIGWASNADGDKHLAYGIWISPTMMWGFEDDTQGVAASVGVGMRSLGDVSEVFVSPKLHFFHVPY